MCLSLALTWGMRYLASYGHSALAGSQAMCLSLALTWGMRLSRDPDSCVFRCLSVVRGWVTLRLNNAWMSRV